MKRVICIDPGHGGKDRWNIGRHGYIEADGNLEFSKYLYNELKKDPDNIVILTRDKDKTLSLTERANIAIDNKAWLFISVHSDASDNPLVSGVTVFESVDLYNEPIANAMGREVASAMGTIFRGVRSRESKKYKGEDYYTVIDKSQDGGIPIVLLIERGFHTNYHDEKLLKDSDNVKKAAKAAAKVINEWGKGEGSNMILKIGDKGPAVKVLQKNLLLLGYDIGSPGADGDFGPLTDAALEGFQSDHGLEVDGIYGPNTQKKMKQVLENRLNYSEVKKIKDENIKLKDRVEELEDTLKGVVKVCQTSL